MPAYSNRLVNRQGVSIIACTNRKNYIGNLLQNFRRQLHAKKELIIIVNGDKIPLLPYLKIAAKDRRIQVYRVPEKHSLGACLNFAVKKTKYSYIAKFDDDDYYSPYYLTDCLHAFKKTNADIVGKRAHYMYLRGSRTLLLRFPHDENQYVSILPGATLVAKKKVFSKVQFPNQSVGEDDQFCLSCEARGFKIYSAGKYNFIAIRRKNSVGHTWIIGDNDLISHHPIIPNVKNITRFIERKPMRDATI